MDYQHKKFTVGLTSAAYATGWDRIFAPKLKCEDCGSTEDDVEDTTCPYSSDIHGKDIPAALCNGCYSNRADDI